MARRPADTERARALDPLYAGLPGLEVVGEFTRPSLTAAAAAATPANCTGVHRPSSRAACPTACALSCSLTVILRRVLIGHMAGYDCTSLGAFSGHTSALAGCVQPLLKSAAGAVIPAGTSPPNRARHKQLRRLRIRHPPVTAIASTSIRYPGDRRSTPISESAGLWSPNSETRASSITGRCSSRL